MLGDLLRDPARCSLVLVTIPEAMSVLETTRTLELLQSQGMPVTAIAVNMIQPAQPDCPFCTGRRDAHARQTHRSLCRCALQIARTHGIAVHRRARLRRIVHARTHGAGKHPAQGVRHRYDFGAGIRRRGHDVAQKTAV